MKMNCYTRKVLWGLVSLFIVSAVAQAKVSNNEPTLDSQPLIRLHAERLPLADILDHISDALRADIYVVSPGETEIRGVHFHDVPAVQVLQTVLHGRSYAIVYHSDVCYEPVLFLGTSGGATLDPPPGIADKDPDRATAPTGSQMDDIQRERLVTREEKLRSQIQELEEQIASGYADSWYEHWITIKDPQYVIHPRERLDCYLKELANLY